jgi:cell division septation protein DedD
MEMDSEDLSLKFRMTGALVWLLLLIIIVPSWYSDPVRFSPDMELADNHPKSDEIVVDKPFVLPGVKSEQPVPQKSASAKVVASEPTPKATEKVSDTSRSSNTANTTTSKVEQKSSVKTSEKPAEKAKASVAKEKWIIRVAAYRSKEKANLLYEHLKYDYDVFVKYFPQSKYYSVRIGPYTDKSLALRDQQQLNRVLRVRSELAKTK